MTKEHLIILNGRLGVLLETLNHGIWVLDINPQVSSVRHQGQRKPGGEPQKARRLGKNRGKARRLGISTKGQHF